MTESDIRHLRNHVVVGTDGSAPATRAVEWAAREAELRRMPLRVVHGFVWPPVPTGFGSPGYVDSAADLRTAAEQIVSHAAEAARGTVPGLAVETHLGQTTGTMALLDAAADAALVVVGSRGHGGFGGLLVGSTAVQLAMYAPCPVVVVRGEPVEDPQAPVVVGVDASPHAVAALGFAFAEASVRGAPLHAVHTWIEPASLGPGAVMPMVYDPQQVQQDETRLLAELLAGWSEKYPDVPVTREVTRGRTGDALREASRGARLLVVGARGVGGFRGLVFGSVSQAMVHHAHCPVAVVRGEK